MTTTKGGGFKVYNKNCLKGLKSLKGLKC